MPHGPVPKMTTTTQLVLRALVDEPDREFYGLEMCRAVGLANGTVHPILARLIRAGWMESRFEEIDAHEHGRPPRRYYRLTRDGLQSARDALARVRTPAPLLEGLRIRRAGEALS